MTLEAISPETDIMWVGERPKGIKKVVVFGKGDISPTPFIVGRALIGAKVKPCGTVLSKLHREEHLNHTDSFFMAGWPLWVRDDTIFCHLATWHAAPMNPQEQNNAWLFAYPPVRDLCGLFRDMGVEVLHFVTTAHLNMAYPDDFDEVPSEGFFVEHVTSLDVKPHPDFVSGEHSLVFSLPSWLFAWLFACMGGESRIVGCGGGMDTLVDWEAIIRFRDYFDGEGIVMQEQHARSLHDDFKAVEKEALATGTQIAVEMMAQIDSTNRRNGNRDSGGDKTPMWG